MEAGTDLVQSTDQHSDDDPAFQRRALELMSALLPSGEVDPIDHALLADRVARAEGRPQEYGTQMIYDSAGVIGVQPIRDPDHADERRAGRTRLAGRAPAGLRGVGYLAAIAGGMVGGAGAYGLLRYAGFRARN